MLLVTHDMASVKRFCTRAMLLEHGRIVATGDPETVGNRYLQLNFSREARAAMEAGVRARARSTARSRRSSWATRTSVFGDGRATITEAWFEAEDGTPSLTLPNGERCAFAMRVRFNEDVEDPLFSHRRWSTAQRMQLFSASSVFEDPQPGLFRAGEEVV